MEPQHIKEILPSILIKTAKKQAEREGIPLKQLLERIGREMPRSGSE